MSHFPNKKLKNLYNITSWDTYNLNYWGVPKCANTSIKHSLSGNKIENPFSIAKSIHKSNSINYITRQDALSNGFTNFSVVRNPYDRFLSLYKDWGTRRNNKELSFKIPVSFDYFLDYTLDKFYNDDVSETHFKSQTYWLANGADLLIENIFTTDKVVDFLKKYNVELVVSNKTKDIDVNLNKKQKSKIYKRYEKDFKLLGFKK